MRAALLFVAALVAAHLGLNATAFQSTPPAAGTRVTAILYQAKGREAARAPALILLHGGNAQGKDGAAPTRVAELLCRAGWRVLAIDLQYFGERSTTLLSSFSDAETARAAV